MGEIKKGRKGRKKSNRKGKKKRNKKKEWNGKRIGERKKEGRQGEIRGGKKRKKKSQRGKKRKRVIGIIAERERGRNKRGGGKKKEEERKKKRKKKKKKRALPRIEPGSTDTKGYTYNSEGVAAVTLKGPGENTGGGNVLVGHVDRSREFLLGHYRQLNRNWPMSASNIAHWSMPTACHIRSMVLDLLKWLQKIYGRIKTLRHNLSPC